MKTVIALYPAAMDNGEITVAMEVKDSQAHRLQQVMKQTGALRVEIRQSEEPIEQRMMQIITQEQDQEPESTRRDHAEETVSRTASGETARTTV